MLTDELKEFIQQEIKEQLKIYSKRMITIETMLNFYQQEQKLQNSAFLKQFLNLQRQFSQFLNEIKEAKTTAGQILQKTEKKLKDIEKVKQNQENQYKEQKRQRNISKEQYCNEIAQNPLQNKQQQYKQEQVQSNSQSICGLQNKSPQSKDQIVYKSHTGLKFHRQNCKCLENSSVPIDRNNLDNMKGLVACLVCKP